MENEEPKAGETPKRPRRARTERPKHVTSGGRKVTRLPDMRTPLRAAVGARIRQAREAALLRVEELAEQLGRAPTTLWKWERGDAEADLESMQVIADVTKRPLHWFYGSESKGPDEREIAVATIVEYMHRVGRGDDPVAALERAIAPIPLSPGLKRQLELHAEDIKARQGPWPDLSPEMRQALMQRLQELQASKNGSA